MNRLVPAASPLVCLLAGLLAAGTEQPAAESAGGWVKYEKNPVLGGSLGTCFDVSVLRESGDGLRWGEPVVVLGPNPASGWEDDVNRPVVLRHDGLYRMWYTGQAKGKSWIGYATSADGKTWKRMSDRPVLSPERPWEKGAVMCPHVLYDEERKLYRMWYSGGEQYEPD